MHRFHVIYQSTGVVVAEFNREEDMNEMIYESMIEQECTEANMFYVAEVKWRGKGDIIAKEIDWSKEPKKRKKKKKEITDEPD